VYWYFKQWEQAKVTEVMLAALREQARVQQDHPALGVPGGPPGLARALTKVSFT
jgi:hypothetical protein